MSNWEPSIRVRVRVAWRVMRGRAVIFRTNFRWETDEVIRIRSIDPTDHVDVSFSLFDFNPEACNRARITFGDTITLGEKA